MRKQSTCMAVVTWLLAAGGAARAGIYNLAEPKSELVPLALYRSAGTPPSQKTAQLWLENLLQIPLAAGAKPDAPLPDLAAAYRKQVGDFDAKLVREGLSPGERLSYAACLLRQARSGDAMRVLEADKAKAQNDPTYLLYLLELAAAYWESPDFQQRAIDTQRQALAQWPKGPVANPHVSAWYRRAERLNLTWMEQRHREALVGARTNVSLDALFPKVAFTGAGGQYEAGRIAPGQLDELPPDAELLVLQLVMWHPQDARLWWLYGELLNARGDVAGAFTVLDDVYRKRGLTNADDLRRHRAVLRQAAEGNAGALPTIPFPMPPRPAEPGPPPALAAPPSVASSSSALPEWRVLVVGAGMGIIVGALVTFQWLEWRRRLQVQQLRRRMAAAATQGPTEVVGGAPESGGLRVAQGE